MESRELGKFRKMAEQRLLQIERIAKDEELKIKYHAFMHEYQQLGHMQPAELTTSDQICFYLPHHPVFKASSTTTSTGEVFDGSGKTSDGLSLNDILLVGTTIQQKLYSTVLRFRTHQVCFTADIAKMYGQILVHPQDQNFQQILWRFSPEEPIQEYQLTTVTYGTASAPFLATRCPKKLADDNEAEHPKAAKLIHNGFYVDDLLSGAPTLTEAIHLQQEVTSILQQAGFTLRKWASNSSAFLNNIPEELHETQNLLQLEKDNSVTTLGLLWNPTTDQLQVKSSITCPADLTYVTKCKVLSIVASVFDPLGLLSSIIISYKVFLQTLWQSKVQWDESLPTFLLHDWNQLYQQLPQVSHIKITHKVLCANAGDIQLHGFCDSCEKAYGACLYLCSIDAGHMMMIGHM
jgi:hypothetical protein